MPTNWITGDRAAVVWVADSIGAPGIPFAPGWPLLLMEDRLLDRERGASRPFVGIDGRGGKCWACDACPTAATTEE